MIAYIYGRQQKDNFTNKYGVDPLSQIPKSSKPNSYLTQIQSENFPYIAQHP